MNRKRPLQSMKHRADCRCHICRRRRVQAHNANHLEHMAAAFKRAEISQ